MKKKTRKPAYKPTLHVGEAIPITDPAIQAAIVELGKMEKPIAPQILLDYFFKKPDVNKKAGKRKIRTGS